MTPSSQFFQSIAPPNNLKIHGMLRNFQEELVYA